MNQLNCIFLTWFVRTNVFWFELLFFHSGSFAAKCWVKFFNSVNLKMYRASAKNAVGSDLETKSKDYSNTCHFIITVDMLLSPNVIRTKCRQRKTFCFPIAHISWCIEPFLKLWIWTLDLYFLYCEYCLDGGGGRPMTKRLQMVRTPSTVVCHSGLG